MRRLMMASVFLGIVLGYIWQSNKLLADKGEPVKSKVWVDWQDATGIELWTNPKDNKQYLNVYVRLFATGIKNEQYSFWCELYDPQEGAQKWVTMDAFTPTDPPSNIQRFQPYWTYTGDLQVGDWTFQIPADSPWAWYIWNGVPVKVKGHLLWSSLGEGIVIPGQEEWVYIDP